MLSVSQLAHNPLMMQVGQVMGQLEPRADIASVWPLLIGDEVYTTNERLPRRDMLPILKEATEATGGEDNAVGETEIRGTQATVQFYRALGTSRLTFRDPSRRVFWELEGRDLGTRSHYQASEALGFSDGAARVAISYDLSVSPRTNQPSFQLYLQGVAAIPGACQIAGLTSEVSLFDLAIAHANLLLIGDFTGDVEKLAREIGERKLEVYAGGNRIASCLKLMAVGGQLDIGLKVDERDLREVLQRPSSRKTVLVEELLSIEKGNSEVHITLPHVETRPREYSIRPDLQGPYWNDLVALIQGRR